MRSEVTDRLDADAGELLTGLGANPPQLPGRLGMQEGKLSTRLDDMHPGPEDRPALTRPRFGLLGRELREKLDRCDPDRARQPFLFKDPSSNVSGDLGGIGAIAQCPPNIEERLVERQWLDVGGDVGEYRHDPSADLGVVGVVARQKHRMRAQPTSSAGGHRRMDAVTPSDVAGSGDDPAVAGAANDDRLRAQLRMAQQLTRHEEGVHVDVDEAEDSVGWRPLIGGITHESRRTARSSPGRSPTAS